jgi:hypothetical protein
MQNSLMSAGAEGASTINFPRLTNSFLASESFFFWFDWGDGAHFFDYAFVDFIN